MVSEKLAIHRSRPTIWMEIRCALSPCGSFLPETSAVENPWTRVFPHLLPCTALLACPLDLYSCHISCISPTVISTVFTTASPRRFRDRMNGHLFTVDCHNPRIKKIRKHRGLQPWINLGSDWRLCCREPSDT